MHTETQSNRGSGGANRVIHAWLLWPDHMQYTRAKYLDQSAGGSIHNSIVTVVMTKMFYVLIFLQSCIWLTWHVQLKSGLTEMVVSGMRFCSSGRSAPQLMHCMLDKVLLMRVVTALTLAWRRSRLNCSWEMDEFRVFSWSLVSVAAARRQRQKQHMRIFMTPRQDLGNETKKKDLIINGSTFHLFLLPQYFHMILQNPVFVNLIMGVFITGL